MISALDNELHKIVCIDEIDETSSSHKWSKKAQKQLEKLNNDSNLTAGTYISCWSTYYATKKY